jgi:glucose 1-dehydrogenase
MVETQGWHQRRAAWGGSRTKWRWLREREAASAAPGPRRWHARVQLCSAPTATVLRPRRAAALPLDVRDRVAVDATVAAVVREFGRLDIVLESAGISHRLNFLDVDAETWDRIIAVNLTSMLHVGQATARQMVKEGGGSIINVTSQLAEVARPERAAYVASKGGARSLTQAMAVDLSALGIRVNAIAPGPTLTGLTRASYADPEARRETEAMIPLGRLGQPDDLVGAVLFLAFDESRWATGNTVTVDGGYLAI